MVFDWFQRRSAQPEASAPESDAAGSQPAVDPIPDAPAEPTPEPDPAPAAPAPTEPVPVVAPETSAEPASTPPEADPVVDDDPLEWARQAYARLKAQQAAQMAAPPEEVAEPPAAAAPAPAPESLATPAVETPPQVGTAEPSPADSAPAPSPPPAAEAPPAAGLSLLEQAAAQRQERQQELDARAIEAPPAAPSPSPTAAPQSTTGADVDQPQLGEFDDTFTWSAEVLAAQGRRVDQVSLEEIDWLSRLRQGLEKTRQGFVTGLLDNLGDDPLTPEVVDDLEALLLRADAGVVATDQVMEALRQRLNEEVVDPSEGIRFLKEQLRNLLEQPIQASGVELLAPERDRLNIWLMVGVNGVGKTTTLGKLANLAVRSGYSAMIAAADTFRAAAVQQVEVWGERSDVPVVANPTANADPAAVVFDAIGAARSKGTDLLLVDTAGRLQTKHNLMEELQKIRRIVDRLAPESKVESLLVLDASQGQNGLKQAMAFAKAADLTGVVITKLDGTARGGVALAVSSEAGLPIRFIGAGEGIRDLRPFNSFEFVEALLAGR
ncbi:signal recognition particle-docking protein FtsY [Synechococcus sp. RS9916]|uniref:signal recognition particle-docking protein FtsY n=1 Tax=Synechococcus sp. RS9916 TaxID=221359 RepID=UPI0000E537BF|nr:signal recognition particle-docking protein FtsY [Synechococcus sp. RS9916]EAU75343.1 signal recognition particle-docking protein FtsY [Synechococcus sp. RS9916]